LPSSDPGQVVHTYVPSASEVTTALRCRNLINLFFTSMMNVGCAATPEEIGLQAIVDNTKVVGDYFDGAIVLM